MSVRIALLSMLLCAVTSNVAEAFECRRGDFDTTLVWQRRCIPFFVNQESTLDQPVLDASLRAWSSSPCSDITLKYAGTTTQADEFRPIKAEQRNVIRVVTSSDEIARYGSVGTIAFVLHSYRVESGEIFDTDIVINEAQFVLGDGSRAECNVDEEYDLESVLTFEFGRALGFDSSTVTGATLFPSIDTCNVEKRDLHDDDRMGLCTVYPAGAPAATCRPPTTYDDPSGLAEALRERPCFDPPSEMAPTVRDESGCDCRTSSRRADPFVLVLVMLAALYSRLR